MVLALWILLSLQVAQSNPAVPRVSEATRAYFIKMENWLRRPERTSSELSSGSHELAKKYLRSNRIQEAIWALRLGGHLEEAQIEEARLKSNLQSGYTLPIYWYEGGKDGTELRRLKEFNIYGIQKRNSASTGHEIAAYKLDRLLGLDIVPLTVGRIDFNGRKVSLQYYVRDGKSGYQLAWERLSPDIQQNAAKWAIPGVLIDQNGVSPDFNSSGYPTSEASMWLLDYLMDNPDRHGNNWLRLFGDADGKTVAFDFGISLGRAANRHVPFQPENLPTGKILQNLRSLTLEQLVQELGEDLELSKIREIFLRVKKAVASASKGDSKNQRVCSSLAKRGKS